MFNYVLYGVLILYFIIITFAIIEKYFETNDKNGDNDESSE